MKMKSAAPPLSTHNHRGNHEDDPGLTPAIVPTHDLEHKGSGVRGRGRIDVVDRFTDPMQRCRCANREIGQTHIVIDGSDYVGRQCGGGRVILG